MELMLLLTRGVHSRRNSELCRSGDFSILENPSFGATRRNLRTEKVLSDARECLPLVRANLAVSHQKLPGFEEISKSRWSQYILKLSRSNSEESCAAEGSWFFSGKKTGLYTSMNLCL